MADSNGKLPDISGIFDIDDSKIPSKIIEKKPDADERKPAGEPVMLKSPVTREEKKAEKLQKEEKRIRKKESARKKRKTAIIKLAALIAAALFLVLGVKALIDNAKRPLVELKAVETGTVSKHYDTTASVVNDPFETGEDRLYAVFVENDFDIYGLEKNMKAKLTNSQGRTVTGIVADIVKEESNSTLIEKIMSLLTDSVIATNANYTVIVLPDDPTAVTQDETVEVQVITEEVRDALVVPYQAVRNDNGQAYVWLYKSFGKKLYRKDVSAGLSSDGVTQIVKGLDAGDTVAVSWSCEETQLHDGIKIKLMK